jgi:hypothetical protein
MILDGYLTFTGTSNGASGGITSGAQTDSPTTGTQIASNIIDIGVAGLPTSASGGGARDLGVADAPALKFSANVTTAFTGGTSLQLEIDGAPDNGSGAPGTYTTMWQSQAIAEANLVVGQLSNIDLPRVVPGQVLPRYYRLRYISVGTHSTGALEANIVIDRFDQIVGSTGALSGYPAGIYIPN